MMLMLRVNRPDRLRGRRFLSLLLPLLLLVAVFGLSFGMALAVHGEVAGEQHVPHDAVHNVPNINPVYPYSTPVPTATLSDAYMALVPGSNGNCPPPSNGGATVVGCRFVLDLWLRPGSYGYPNEDLVAHLSYLTFTYSVLQNARVDQIATSCILTSTVAPDLTNFDGVLQNEVCNGPLPCNFAQGGITDPGSMAYVSGGLCEWWCIDGPVRLALVGLCATAPGRAVLHWQFSPPAPPERDTEIITYDGQNVSGHTLFSDYVINVVTATPTATPTSTPRPTAVRDAYLLFVPEGSAPHNGGIVNVGDRFVLGLWLNPGSYGYPNEGIVAQESYLTFTYSVLQNARVDQIATSCILTSTVTPDLTTFDGVLQNEVCNGPNPCNFSRGITDPGSIAYAAGELCEWGCVNGPARMAQVGLCATAPGRAVLHWQFSPPAPPDRDTEIITYDGQNVSGHTLFTDYVINVVTATPTATPTSTPRPTAVRDAYLLFVPEGSAPRNGGIANVGDRFVLGMWINPGSYPKRALAAQQSYLTFTNEVIQNARVSDFPTTCTLTSTVSPDLTTFDADLQNEVCNGPSPCNFPRGGTTEPGSMAYASGCLGDCAYIGPFQVAQVGLCATAPGRAVLHWQFSPPAPPDRDTEIVAMNGDIVSDPALFTDYIINVVGPSQVISGHVNWQSRPPQPNPLQQLPITLTLKSGATELNYASRATNASGYFTAPVAGLSPGAYSWRAKNPKYLANSGTVILTGDPSTPLEIGLMRGGDADNDNIVNINDLNILKNSFGKGVGEPGYDDRADFTGDQWVNISDYLLLKLNFGQNGAPPIRPFR